MSVDRTQLFFELTKSNVVLSNAQGHSPLSAEALVRASSSSLSVASSQPPLSSFTRAAGEVSRDLQKTAKLIQDLTQLVKRRGVFDGASTSQAIESITTQVKADVSRLSNQLDGLQSFVDAKRAEAMRAGAAPGKPKTSANPTSAGANTTNGTASTSSYDVLNSIHGLSHSDMVLASLKQQLLGFSVGLRDVISARGEGLKQARDRRSAFGRTAAKDLGRPLELTAPPPPISPTTSLSTHMSRQAPSETDSSAFIPIGGSHHHHQKPSFETMGQRTSSLSSTATSSSAANAFQIVTQQQLDPEVAFVNSRAQDVRHVEAAVTEIATLFGRLATLVAEQGNQIDRIDGDIESAGGQMDLASTQLQRAYDSAASNRLLALRIIGVLIAFIFGFVFFIA
jgi:hypothetical protein